MNASFCTVTDFSAGALPIGVIFCTAVRPHLGRCSPTLGVIVPEMAEAFGVNM